MTDFSQWPAQEPPDGFAGRVLASRRQRRRWPLVTAAAAAAVVAAFALLRTENGAAEPVRRAAIAMGRRATAVAEPGARLRWSISPSGRASVVQDRGEVFYRVEPGGPFEVDAGGARIEVLGTCFRVEVGMSSASKMALSAAAGAAAATAVVVTVYEGRVAVASPAGAVQVAAGERARSEPGQAVRVEDAHAAPTAPATTVSSGSPEASSREQLIQRDRAQQAEIATLRNRVRDLEKKVAVAPSAGEASHPAERGPALKYRDFTPEELLEMARNCEVRVDLLPLSREPFKLGPDLSAQLHLSEDEQARVNATVNDLAKETIARLRALYVEATGDVAGADNLEPFSLQREILHKSPEPVIAAARARVARERAGLETPPADPRAGSIPERLFRYLITVNDTLQHSLEPELGAQQAAAVRDRLSWSRMNMSGCANDGR
ncbi:MAG: hypothetical protein ABR567_06825 [Myxococcales bacterium]|nr:FecR family protein [Myxococcales bacterium]